MTLNCFVGEVEAYRHQKREDFRLITSKGRSKYNKDGFGDVAFVRRVKMAKGKEGLGPYYLRQRCGYTAMCKFLPKADVDEGLSVSKGTNKDCGKKKRVTGFTPHSLRHSSLTNLQNLAGTDVSNKTLMTLSGIFLYIFVFLYFTHFFAYFIGHNSQKMMNRYGGKGAFASQMAQQQKLAIIEHNRSVAALKAEQEQIEVDDATVSDTEIDDAQTHHIQALNQCNVEADLELNHSASRRVRGFGITKETVAAQDFSAEGMCESASNDGNTEGAAPVCFFSVFISVFISVFLYLI